MTSFVCFHKETDELSLRIIAFISINGHPGYIYTAIRQILSVRDAWTTDKMSLSYPHFVSAFVTLVSKVEGHSLAVF